MSHYSFLKGLGITARGRKILFDFIFCLLTGRYTMSSFAGGIIWGMGKEKWSLEVPDSCKESDYHQKGDRWQRLSSSFKQKSRQPVTALDSNCNGATSGEWQNCIVTEERDKGSGCTDQIKRVTHDRNGRWVLETESQRCWLSFTSWYYVFFTSLTSLSRSLFWADF